MQMVIELGRYTLPLKTPLREIVIVHPDPQFHADVRALESYIVKELNIRTVTFTACMRGN
ncbi:hypothetical protein HDU87_006703 [Geranomyces variabilis]|uniref:Uncharacterized protein n=1 Tax=Geranomyces variabilis TaxID=109894 RepID=A0AAD5XUX2_9FUNG|nr:hypothetical protein HDU87_006703 [Geranomyces variabilis]